MKTKRYTQTDAINTHRNCTISTMPSRRRWNALVKFPVLLLTAVLVLAGTSVHASDPIGVFAKIDKVVLEPNDTSPERIQLWGSFCLADEKDRDSYLAPQKGFLYYKLPSEKSEAALKEWNDLKAIAGSDSVIGFGSRHLPKAKVRGANEKPENADAYPVAFGLVKSSQRSSSYAPIKALQAGAAKKSSEPKENPPK
jgi:hypothetical protein